LRSTLYDNVVSHGFSLSALGSINSKKDYFGGKLIYSHVWTFTNYEIGIVNYSDFVTNDCRLLLGAGLSLFGKFSIMYHYGVPLKENPFEDITVHSISFTFN